MLRSRNRWAAMMFVLVLLGSACSGSAEEDVTSTAGPDTTTGSISTTAAAATASPPVTTSAVATSVAASTTAVAATTTVAPPISPADPATVVTCEELADQFIVAAQQFIDVLGERSLDEYWGLTPEDDVPQDLIDGADAFGQAFVTIRQRGVDVDCDERMDDLICERQPQLQLRGGASEAFIHENSPCGLIGTLGAEAGAEAEARLDAWMEERAD